MTAKEKILQTTEHLFAEKGYDGTKVDEIAHRAQVNKALIYYYYDNKHGLLKELVIRHVQETLEFKETLLEEIDNYSEEEIKKISQRLFNFLKQKSKILSILTIETLKSGSQDHNIFRILHPIYEKTLKDLEEKGYKIDNHTEQILNLFFFGTIPVTLFIALKEKWSEFYGIDSDETEKIFQAKIDEFHINFYQALINDKTNTSNLINK
ncbi:TetR/AcrR family transcriptional regulator [Natranaerobius thermophilus]|uniref:TetR/AcrR family transcriptional regulator n=1 Tax=Natranaerobius thermophilus TaxID=375929 RepID=UPI002F4060E1